ncbi:MAG: hypothetical protein RIC35_06310 [Marinoscillum sp.]
MKTLTISSWIILLLFSCSKKPSGTSSEVSVPIQKASLMVEIPSTSTDEKSNISQEALLTDVTKTKRIGFNGLFAIAEKYEIQVILKSKGLSIKWDQFGEINYSRSKGKYESLNYYRSETPGFGRFIENPKSGNIIFEVIEQTNVGTDTVYYEVGNVPKKKLIQFDDFDGYYVVVSSKQDSVFFEVKKIAPFKYGYTISENPSDFIYYKGRDPYGLMKYGDYFTMNSDHISGLYIAHKDTNSTVIKLDKGK